MTPQEAFDEARKRFTALEIAEALGITRQAVYGWRTDRVPLHHAPKMEKLTGIPRHVWAPELYEEGE